MIAGAAFSVQTLQNAASNALAVDNLSRRLYDAIGEDNGGSNPLLMRSTDGGDTWSPGAGFSSQFASLPALGVDALGRLYLTFNSYVADGPFTVTSRVVSYSTDGGASFSVPAPLHTTGITTGLEHFSGGLTLSPDGSTFADFTLETCGSTHCVVLPPEPVVQGTFGQTGGFDEQDLTFDAAQFLPINGFYHAGKLLGIAGGPPATVGGPARFGLVGITFGEPPLFWPLPVSNVQQLSAIGTSSGAVFATRQSYNPGFIVPGFCD